METLATRVLIVLPVLTEGITEFFPESK